MFESNGKPWNADLPIWQMVFLRFGSGKTSFYVFDGPRKAGGGQSFFGDVGREPILEFTEVNSTN